MKKTFAVIFSLILILALSISCSDKSESDYLTVAMSSDLPPTMYSDISVSQQWQGTGYNPEGPASVEGQNPPVYSDMSNVYGISEEKKMAFEPSFDDDSSTDGSSSVQIGIPQGRKIILNAEVRMETLEFDKTIQSLTGAIQRNGGYVSDSSQLGSGDGNSRRDYFITARIPTDNYNTFLTDTAEAGTIIYKQESSSDVTSQYIDVEARLLTLKAQEERLLALLEKSGDLESLIIIEERLSEVRYEIERFEVKKRTFDDLISYSTVNISVQEVKIITETNDAFFPRLKDSISGSWNNFVAGLQNFLFGFIYALPKLIIWVAVIVVIVILSRKMIKKRKAMFAKRQSNTSNNKDSLSNSTKKDDIE